MLLAFADSLGDVGGVSTKALHLFLVVFTLYGVVVLFGLRRGAAPPRLAGLAIAMNAAFVVVVAVSAALSDLTSRGSVVHVLLILNGLGVTGKLVWLSRTR